MEKHLLLQLKDRTASGIDQSPDNGARSSGPVPAQRRERRERWEGGGLYGERAAGRENCGAEQDPAGAAGSGDGLARSGGCLAVQGAVGGGAAGWRRRVGVDCGGRGLGRVASGRLVFSFPFPARVAFLCNKRETEG